MSDPIFWLGVSVGLVSLGILAVLITLAPAALELAHAARSVQRFFDTMQRDLPPTLEAIRLTGLEVGDIASSVDEGVRDAGRIVKRVDRSLEGARTQAETVQVTTRSAIAGLRAGWKVFVAERQTAARSLSSDPTMPPLPPTARNRPS